MTVSLVSINLDSPTVITPSLPAFSIAWAMMSLFYKLQGFVLNFISNTLSS